MWWALIWNNIESYDYNNYDDNKDFDGYEGYEGFDDFDDIINQEGGIQIYMFEPFAWDYGKNGCRIYWSHLGLRLIEGRREYWIWLRFSF